MNKKNCMGKIIWLLVNNVLGTISFTLQYFTGQMKGQATSTLLDENLTCEFKRRNSFTFSKSCTKTERFLYCLWKAAFINSHLNLSTWPESKRKFPCGFDAAFSKTVFREETLQPAQVTLTKMPRNEANIYQETDFLSTVGHLLTSSGCFLT